MAGSQFQTYAYKHLTVALCLVFIFGLVIIFSGALDTDDTGDLTILRIYRYYGTTVVTNTLYARYYFG